MTNNFGPHQKLFQFFHFIYSLAVIHATGLAYQTALGGRLSFLTRFPLIKEENMPKGIYILDLIYIYFSNHSDTGSK